MLGTQCHFPRDADGRPSKWHRYRRKAADYRKGGKKKFVPEGSPPPAPKVSGSMHWRVGCAGEPTLPLRTASGPQSHALRGKDDYFPEWSHSPHTHITSLLLSKLPPIYGDNNLMSLLSP